MKKEFQIPEKIALFIFVVWALFLSIEYWGFGPASYVKIPDAGDSMLPSRLALNVDARDHELGNWNPNLLAGVDRTAQGEGLGVLDALFVLLPGWLAYGSLMFIQRFIAGYFTYKVLTKHLGIAPLLALFPAFFYSLFSQNQINLQFDGFTVYDGLGSPALPMMLYTLGYLAADKKKRLWLTAFLAFGLGLVISSASSFVLSIFFFPIIIFWLLIIYPGWRRSCWIVFGAFVFGWLVLETPEIIATFLLSPISQRSLRESCTGVAVGTFASLPNFLRAYVFKPDNIPALLAGVAGLALWRPKTADRRGFAILGLLLSFVVLSFFLPLVICSSYNPIGFVKGFNYSRFYFYLPFIITVFAGIGLQNLVLYLQTQFSKDRFFQRQLPAVLTALLLLFVLYLAVGVKQTTLRARSAGSNYANLYANPYLQFLGEIIVKNDPYARAVMLFDIDSPLQKHPGYLWPYGINTLDGYTGIYTLKFAQFWALVIDPMMQRYPDCRYGLKHAEGNNRVYLSNHCEVGERVEINRVGELYDLDLLSLAGVRYFVSDLRLDEPRLSQIDTTGISCPTTIPGCTQYYLYENTNAFPSFLGVSEVVELPNYEKVWDSLNQTELITLTKKVFVNSDELRNVPIDTLGDSDFEFNIDEYSSDRIVVSFSSVSAKIVVANMAYSSDWKVWIDGQETLLFPVDLIFSGLFVPAGEHTIELRYLPKYSIEYWIYRLTN